MGLLDTALLCASACVSCMLLRGRYRLVGAAALAKLGLILFFAAMIDVGAIHNMIVRLNVDQWWYSATAASVADAVGKHGLLIDYQSVVGNQNFLYNALLGVYAAANGSLNPVSYLLLNFAVYGGILFFCLRIRRALSPSPDNAVFLLALFLLPSLNIYSMLMLRDLLIGLVLCACVDSILSRHYLRLAAFLLVMFLLRNQFAFILFLAAALDFYLRNRKAVALPLRVSVGGLLVMAAVLASLNGQYGYVWGYFNPLFLYGFFSWLPFGFLGLDFVIQDSSVLAASFGSLLLYRLISPETFLLPLAFLVSVFGGTAQSGERRRLVAVLLPVLLIYCFGYYTEYRLMFVRLFIPFYPLLFVLSYDTVVDALSRVRRFFPGRISVCE